MTATALMMTSLIKFHWRGLAAPISVLVVLAMMMLPLPPFLLDVLFTFNIALSLIVALVVFNLLRPLDFAAFPSVLLMATLLRLSLNVASTRVVLLHGHEGTDAAGKVIEAFGEFVIGGNYAVGLVVFAILTVINFVVITKGASRVSEVAARFTLDAMPGKQMAIDADLSTGLTNQEQARERRNEVRDESDFYGSMDGASKFVRGDAAAGILILFINIIGGFVIGVFQHDMSVSEALKNYTLLTVGDGLVAQIPSLMLSMATAVIVTRVSRAQDMSDQVMNQVFGQPRALRVTGIALGVLGIIPGMPHVAFLFLGAGCGAIAYLISQRQVVLESTRESNASLLPTGPTDVGWEDLTPVDTIGLEVGYRLIPLVDHHRGGELMSRIKGVRRKLSQELGFLLPPVHIRDNLDLSLDAYRITLMGVLVGEAEVYIDRLLAINPGNVEDQITGIATHDPAFGLQAFWIKGDERENAQTMGYTVVDPGTVIATHLSHITQAYAHELLGHEEVQQLLDRLARTAPKLVEDLVPKRLSLGMIVKVLQNLLAEHVPIRNIRSIVEALADHASQSQDPIALTAVVRIALSRQIIQGIIGLGINLPVITLAPELEQVLLQSLPSNGETSPNVEPGLAERLQKNVEDIARRQEMQGEPAVLLVTPLLRLWLSRLVRTSSSNLHVLAYNEVPDNRRVRLVGILEK